MIRLIKYLKPFTLSILLSIALLFAQAMADLALPNYMADIVNIGIQQSGVEDALPRALRRSQMERLAIFLSAEEMEAVRGAYTLVEQGTPDYARHLADYPALAEQPVYVLRKLNPAEMDALRQAMTQPLVIVAGIEQALADPSRAAALSQAAGFDLSKLPPGSDVFTLLAKLPAAQKSLMVGAIRQRFTALSDPMLLNQMAIAATRGEYVALGVDMGRLQNGYIARVGGRMLLLSLFAGACTVAVSLLSARVAAGMARDLRRDVFRKVMSFSNAEFDRFSTASLITRSTNDVMQVQMVVIMMIRMVFYAPIIGVGGVIRAVERSASMWWIIALAVAVLLALVITVFTISLPKFKLIQSLIDRLNLVMRENLTGMMVIRAFNRQEFERERFDRANRDLTGVMLFVSRIMVVMMPVMMLVMNGLSLLIIWVGAHQVAQSNIQVGDMMAFLQYAMQIVFSFLMMSFMFIILPRASVSGARLAEVLESEPTIRDPERPRRFSEPFSGRVEFRNVSFRYPGAEEDVLHDISFVAPPGQTTAIIGSTGSGKSTLINLIPRFYDVSAGAILVNGVDVREVTQHDLRAKIGYIPQRGVLFSGTVESNLRYADEEADEDALREAIETAQAAEFVFANPDGLAAEIAQGGANVSGGQKQRLAIARALVKKPPIYIFDDSFSAVDFKTDAALRRALRERTGASTVLIVTQRIATIKSADQIVVLDEGRVVGKGTHRELLTTCEAYREMAMSQLSEEELA